MIVGVLQVELLIPEAFSLKDKRRVLRSVKDRLHREHMAAVAEIGAMEKHNTAVLAVAVVGTETARLADVLDRITLKLRALAGAELAEAVREFVAVPILGRIAEESDGNADAESAASLAAELIARGDAALDEAAGAEGPGGASASERDRDSEHGS